MRDLVILVADLQCEATLLGFFQRNQCHLSLGCGKFVFDPRQDLFRDTKNDPGVWKNGHEILRSLRATHRNALIILDNAWEGSPGVETIEGDLSRQMTGSGWVRERFEVVVIDPELESWIWQDNHHVERALGHDGVPSLRFRLEQAELWPSDCLKPPDPKRAVETVNGWYRFGPPSPVFQEIASKVTLKACVDPAFRKMRQALRRWFPAQP